MRHTSSTDAATNNAPTNNAPTNNATTNNATTNNAPTNATTNNATPSGATPSSAAPSSDAVGSSHQSDAAHATHPAHKEAGALAFFAMQNVRHAIPVAAVRTVVQGVVAPELARAVASHPDVALATQVGLTAWSGARRILSQMHSEANPTKANAGFTGDITQSGNGLSRRAWQAVQTVGIAGGDLAALGLTVASRFEPALIPVAQAAAALQLVSHMQAQVREGLRPTINTVHVGNDHGAPKPADGRNLRGQDVGWTMKGTFGAATAGIDMVAQLAMQRTLGGAPAWQASRGLAVGAGAIAGVANMLTSSVEDHLVETAQAKRMQGTDPSHVRHLHWESKNPLKREELERQFERVDARVFNTLVPGMIALGLTQAMRPAMAQAHWHADQRQSAEAGLHAAVVGLMGGALLALTVAAYQMNDTVRKDNNKKPASQPPANPGHMV